MFSSMVKECYYLFMIIDEPMMLAMFSSMVEVCYYLFIIIDEPMMLAMFCCRVVLFLSVYYYWITYDAGYVWLDGWARKLEDCDAVEDHDVEAGQLQEEHHH